MVQSTASAEPTISEALQAAAQRGMPWVGVRRDFAAPEKLLSDLLVATARHSDEVVPGFAVFLADGEPAPVPAHPGDRRSQRRARSPGSWPGRRSPSRTRPAPSWTSWSSAMPARTRTPRMKLETLVINREQELYDAAVERARGQGLAVTWITAASVKDLWRVVSDQLSQHDYDLVIDDLGDVSLARVGLRTTIQGTLGRRCGRGDPASSCSRTPRSRSSWSWTRSGWDWPRRACSRPGPWRPSHSAWWLPRSPRRRPPRTRRRRRRTRPTPWTS